MPDESAYPKSWLERIPARVFACLRPGEFTIILLPGEGLADGGSFRHIPAALLPPELRVPNTEIWVRMNENHEITKIWCRDDTP